MTISAKPPVYDLSVETIYLDSLFALNAIIDYLLLLCSARAAGAVLHRRRLALAAVLGGLWAVASVLPDQTPLRGKSQSSDVLMKAKYDEPVSAADLALAQMRAPRASCVRSPCK